ncbi:hypothetical protein ACRRTK_023680 [Alexandromys fortis]
MSSCNQIGVAPAMDMPEVLKSLLEHSLSWPEKRTGLKCLSRSHACSQTPDQRELDTRLSGRAWNQPALRQPRGRVGGELAGYPRPSPRTRAESTEQQTRTGQAKQGQAQPRPAPPLRAAAARAQPRATAPAPPPWPIG